MRKALWSTAALVALLSGTGVSPLSAADQTTINIVDGSGDPMTTWKFEPSAITVPAGTKVVWKNTGNQPHTATAEDGSFKSDYLSNGMEFSTVVTKTVKFKCEPHPWMTGTINVAGSPPAGSGDPTTTTTAASTTTTAAAGESTTTTTVTGAGAGASSTTTTTAAGAVTTVTTAPSATTPTSAPEGAGSSAAPAAGTAQAAAEDHGSQQAEGEKKEDDDDSSPIGIAFAGVSTLLLMAVTGKLLSSKS